MSKIYKKHFSVYNFEKLENWLNQMADDGLTLSSVESVGFSITGNRNGKYEFIETKKGEYKFRVLLLDKPHIYYDSHKQINFVSGTGAECVGYYNRFAIFRQKTEDGDFNLYSDNNSQIKFVSILLKSLIAYAISYFILWILTIILLLPASHFVVEIDIILLSLLFLGFETYFIVGIIKMAKKLKKLKQEATLFE